MTYDNEYQVVCSNTDLRYLPNVSESPKISDVETNFSCRLTLHMKPEILPNSFAQRHKQELYMRDT